jgi:hypothetical protein
MRRRARVPLPCLAAYTAAPIATKHPTPNAHQRATNQKVEQSLTSFTSLSSERVRKLHLSRSSRRKEAHSACESSESAEGFEPPYVGCYDFSDTLSVLRGALEAHLSCPPFPKNHAKRGLSLTGSALPVEKRSPYFDSPRVRASLRALFRFRETAELGRAAKNGITAKPYATGPGRSH